MDLRRGFSLQVGLYFVLFVFSGRLAASLTITTAVVPTADTSITGNEQITIEFFATSNVNQGVKGGQIGMFCVITDGTTVLSSTGMGSGLTSVGGVGALCSEGLAAVNVPNCFVSRTPLPLAAPCQMLANQAYFMASITYDVSDCAANPVEVRPQGHPVAELAELCDGIPEATEETRFRDDGPGIGNLIPIVSCNVVTLVPDLGTCCDGLFCVAEGINEYCCEQGLFGGDPGVFDPFGTTCVATPCECTNNAQCNDGLFCNGVETCNIANGVCQVGTPPNCNDGFPCTADSCNETTNSCNHIPNHAVCNDGLFCNGVETCSVTSGCVAGSDPCPGENCQESDDLCLPPSCDAPTVLAQGSRHLLVTPAPAPVPVAILVTGDLANSDISCVSAYVQTDGALEVSPHFALPAVWGSVDVHGPEIIPEGSYTVVIDCTIGFSIDVTVETNRWGDLDDSGMVNLDDLIILLEGFAGEFEEVPLLAVDLLPCDGNALIDLDDLLAILEAFEGEAYTVICPVPCP